MVLLLWWVPGSTGQLPEAFETGTLAACAHRARCCLGVVFLGLVLVKFDVMRRLVQFGLSTWSTAVVLPWAVHSRCYRAII